ncbi:hypothetical protein [Brucella rhizosphaerae]|uniref:Uncharacterized protein n=1 Tax=Brucella rhizosphaerae TaxID=571254 RepID=A0A256FKW8_9HYPH|nr:hypothetical protein [Brucella rhizosphaerae]OYR15504.1 hypothetical protein CEV32_4779 [Brucella rhizosphaerae]
MSDKENVEKENEQFSSSILYVATAVYVGVCAMVFGALYTRHQSFGDAFLKLMADYGTILAGIPVLVAVVVAKQQLDANRRQHVATIKRSVQKELDVLRAYEKLSETIQNLYVEDENISIGYLRAFGDFIDRRIDTINSYTSPLIDPDLPLEMTAIKHQSSRSLEFMKKHIDNKIEIQTIKEIRLLKLTDPLSVNGRNPFLLNRHYFKTVLQLDESVEILEKECRESLFSARAMFLKCLDGALKVTRLVEEERSRLSQYWS